jgi:Zn-dependent peptidase ImmA (M78 family)
MPPSATSQSNPSKKQLDSPLRRGFKADAERVADAIRQELRLNPTAPVSCTDICEQLGIPIITVPDLAASGASLKSIRCITSPEAKFSAMTVASGTKRLIVYNPHHPPGRRANSLAHEISHVLLEHPLAPALGIGGCRQWNPVLEAEADWQAGALLVPRQAALEWMQTGESLEDGAHYFGVSLALFRWRVNQTGILRHLNALAKFKS